MNSSQIARISLGTANLTKSYGVMNLQAMPLGEIKKIDLLMTKFEITKIDTALAYSVPLTEYSEYEADFIRNRDVTTRSAIKNIKSHASESEIIDAFQSNLNRKNLTKYKNVLVHDFSDLQGQKSSLTLKVLDKLKSFDLTERVGFSAYNSAEIDYALHLFRPDVIQVPLNIFDQRLINSGHINMIKNMGIRVQARSIFLQGLLLSESETLPAGFEFASNYFKRWWKFIESNSLNSLELCLSFISSLTEIDDYIIGVNDAVQLEQILKAELSQNDLNLDKLAITDIDLLDPRRWST